MTDFVFPKNGWFSAPDPDKDLLAYDILRAAIDLRIDGNHPLLHKTLALKIPIEGNTALYILRDLSVLLGTFDCSIISLKPDPIIIAPYHKGHRLHFKDPAGTGPLMVRSRFIKSRDLQTLSPNNRLVRKIRKQAKSILTHSHFSAPGSLRNWTPKTLKAWQQPQCDDLTLNLVLNEASYIAQALGIDGTMILRLPTYYLNTITPFQSYITACDGTQQRRFLASINSPDFVCMTKVIRGLKHDDEVMRIPRKPINISAHRAMHLQKIVDQTRHIT